MVGRSSGAPAASAQRRHWLRTRWTRVSFAIGLALATSSVAAAQAGPATEPGPTRRWTVPEPERKPQPEPQPPRASAEPQATTRWGAMLARERVDEPIVTRRRWYGWQGLLADGLAIAVVAGIQETESTLVGCAIGVLGVPLIHLAHENVFNTALSFSMRALAGGFLTLGIFIAVGDDIDFASDDEDTVGAIVVIAGFATYAAAIIVDAAVLSFEQVPRQAVAVVPWLDPRRGSAGVRFVLAL